MKSFINKYKKILAIISLISIVVFGYFFPTLSYNELDEIHKGITKRYKVKHINNETLKAMSLKGDVVLFDVRERREFEVSHIENAIQINPNLEAEDFFELYADDLNNKVVVFYCSVGERSSLMLEKLQDKLPASGVSEAYNLEGGAFRWHNDQIDLVKQGQPTRDIHPYNKFWGRLVDNKESITY